MSNVMANHQRLGLWSLGIGRWSCSLPNVPPRVRPPGQLRYFFRLFHFVPKCSTPRCDSRRRVTFSSVALCCKVLHPVRRLRGPPKLFSRWGKVKILLSALVGSPIFDATRSRQRLMCQSVRSHGEFVRGDSPSGPRPASCAVSTRPRKHFNVGSDDSLIH